MEFLAIFFGAIFASWALMIGAVVFVIVGLSLTSIYDDTDQDSGIGAFFALAAVAAAALWAYSTYWTPIQLPAFSWSLLAAYAGLGILVGYLRWYLYVKRAVKAHNEGRSRGGNGSVSIADGKLTVHNWAKYKVASWIIYWPFYLVNTIFGDLARVVKDWVADAITVTIAKIAAHVAKDIKVK